MNPSHEYDFAISYAGPDQPFVEKVVGELRARGMRVFFAPDQQADIIGRNLIDYLSEVYLTQARYCLAFFSKHYAERKWTGHERQAAQARALDQSERYIIPIRLDDTKIPGVFDTIADIRHATPKQIADLAVAVLLRDEAPTVVSGDHQKQDRLAIRVVSFTDFDTELLRRSFKPFQGWVVNNAHMIPVEMRLPGFLTTSISDYEGFLKKPEFQNLDAETQKQFAEIIKMIRTNLFHELLRVPACVLVPSQPSDAASLVLTDGAIELIRRYVLAKVVAAARCLVTWQLKGFPGPSWARQFADCDVLYTPTVMGGLPWLCRSEGSERHLWFDADITNWGGTFEQVRIYRPSSMVISRGKRPSADNILRFIAPQLLERELRGELPRLLFDAFHYPERMEAIYRNENVIESHHFHELNLHNSDWKEALPAAESLRDEILDNLRCGALTRLDAAHYLDGAVFAFGHAEVFSSAIRSVISDEPNAAES